MYQDVSSVRSGLGAQPPDSLLNFIIHSIGMEILQSCTTYFVHLLIPKVDRQAWAGCVSRKTTPYIIGLGLFPYTKVGQAGYMGRH